MAWGLFNKIKKGFKKVGSAFKKGVNWVNDKIVKPFKPLIKTAVNAFVPGGGAVVDIASDGIDAITKEDWQKLKQTGQDFSTWIKNKR